MGKVARNLKPEVPLKTTFLKQAKEAEIVNFFEMFLSVTSCVRS